MRRSKRYDESLCRLSCPGRVADGDGRELGRLDKHVAGGIVDFRLSAAHDSTDGDGVLGVANHAHLGAEGVSLVVDGLDRLARQRTADDDLAAFELAEVERGAAAGRTP